MLTGTASDRSAVLWIIFLGACLSLAACSDNPEESRDDRISRQLEEEAESASPSQRSALEDDSISYLEYEEAVFATIECLKSEGLVVDGPHEDLANPGQLTFAYGGTETAEELDQLEPIYNRCYTEHSSVIDQAYAFQNRLSPEEESDRDRRILDCMIDNFSISLPVDGPDVLTIDEIRAIQNDQPGLYQECLIVVNTSPQN